MSTRSTRWVSVVLVAVLSALVGVQMMGLAAQRAAGTAAEDRVALATAIEQIRYYDEVLTMSARFAAASGDETYVQRYEDAVPELDAAIATALAVVPDPAAQRAVQSTGEANDALIALETESFERLAAGDRDGALAAVTSPAYTAHKADYRRGMEEALERLEASGRAEQAEAGREQRVSLAAAAGLAVLLVGLWAATARSLRASQRVEAGLADDLRQQADADPLTGLPNRRLLHRRLAEELAAGHDATVLVLDLDGFKAANDTGGHARGDALLREVGSRVAAEADPSAVAARLGGDEFAVLVPGADRDASAALAARLVAVLGQPYECAPDVVIGASVGVATTEEAGDDADALVGGADLAMYAAKTSGGGTWRWYVASMHTELLARVRLEGELREGLSRDEMEVHYQPTFDVVTGARRHVEALVRWRHPTRGLLGPGTFVPLAEETGLVTELGRVVLAQACLQLSRWRGEQGDRAPSAVAVNVSPPELCAPGYVETVLATLAAAGLEAHHLVLEVTEGLVIEGGDRAIEVLSRVRSAGVRVSIDDFGTGHSSLARLRELPVDELKVDRSFLAAAAPPDGSPGDRRILEVLVSLADRLGLDLVAEGVETSAQLALLRRLGCATAQGFLLGRPQPAGHPSHEPARLPTPRHEARLFDRAPGVPGPVALGRR